MLRIFTSLIALYAFSALPAQQTTEFIFGDPEGQILHRVFTTANGHLNVIGGHTVDGQPHVQFFQLDAGGAVLLEKDLGLMAASLLVEPDPDGSFWLARFGQLGYTFSHFNATGLLQDSFVYSHPDFYDDYFFAIRRAPDGGFVMAFKEYIPLSLGVRLVRLSATGNVVFNKFIQSEDAELNNNCLAVLPDGRTVLAVIDYTQGYRVICYSPTGALLWTKPVPAIPTFAEFGLLPMPNGQVVFYGPNGSLGNDYFRGYAAAYDVSGNFVWNRTFESLLPNFSVYKAMADGDFVVLAGDYSGQGIGAAVVKIDPGGNIVFIKKFPLLNIENGQFLLTGNGDYLISGYTWRQYNPGMFIAEEAYGLNIQPDGTLNWYVEGQYNWVNAIRSAAQAGNGDMWLGGNYRPAGSTGPFDHYLLKISDIGPLLTHQIHGRLALDSLDNCAPDPGEPALPTWTVRAKNDAMTRYSTTGPDGGFTLRLNGDDAELTVLTPNGLWASCATGYPADFSVADTVEINPQAKQLAQCPLLRLDASALFLRRCFDNTYYFNWRNDGTATAENTQLTIQLDTFFSFVAASLPFASQNGQVLTFDLGDLPPDAWGELKVTVKLNCQASLGQVHCLSAALHSPGLCPDDDGAQAAARDCQPNTGSFDPNDKRAFVYDQPWEGPIQPDLDIKYQIRFQNTGTDTAFNVIVVDTLPPQLNLDDIVPGAASHPYTSYRIGENILKIAFNDIRLPDSLTNEPASHGFVNIRVRQNPGLPDGTRIENKAAIYFDLNEPVITNTHQLVVDRTLATQNHQAEVPLINLFPNPSADGLIRVESGSLAIERVEIFNTQGCFLGEVNGPARYMTVQLPPLSGIFWLRVHRRGMAPHWCKAVKMGF